MLKARKIGLFPIIMTIVTALFVGFIFIHSTMNAEISDGESLSALSFFQDLFLSLGLPFELSNFIIRKAAHFSEFAVLGILTALTLYAYTGKTIKYLITTFFICLATAVTDETIQLFVPGRSGRIQDVLIDFAGSFCGIAIVTLILLLLVRHRKSKVKKV